MTERTDGSYEDGGAGAPSVDAVSTSHDATRAGLDEATTSVLAEVRDPKLVERVVQPPAVEEGEPGNS